MSDSRVKSRRVSRSALLCASVLTGLLSLTAFAAVAQDATTPAAAPAPADDNTVVVVTGYRGSLQSSAQAKKRAVGFQDSIFAEDIGKFPDNNLAESFNRIPGVVISREIDGEGTTLSIRGLGPSFSRVLLNGAAVEVASTGDVNTNDSNREVDLDIFPPELFTQLTVYKTPNAAQLEGGAAGVVDMRQARPFDFKNDRIQFSLEGSKNNLASGDGYKGSLVASHRFGNWGILAGVAKQHSVINVEGFESVGWTNPALTAAQDASGSRNSTGGGNWTIPATVPAGTGNGLTDGATIDQAFLLAHNPGVTIDDIDNGIIPRLGRPMHYYGTRDRTSAIISLEYKNDNFHFWLDTMAAQKDNDQQRTDIDFVGRSGQAIPLNMKVDRSDCSAGCVVTNATYANAQFFLEYRPWFEKDKFFSVNPGFEWKLSDTLTWTFNANYTISNFRRDSPTVLVVTKPGDTATYTNTDGDPVITSSMDLNDPNNFQWNGGRVNLQSELRQTQTRGLHTDIKWGTGDFNVQFGLAYDDTQREITPLDNSQAWQNATCGDNPSVYLPAPNSQPACKGDNLATSAALAAGYPAYPGYGTAYTAGQTGGVTYSGSLIPQSALASYLTAGPFGYINVDWDKLAKASNYYTYLASAPAVSGSNISSPRSFIREKVGGAYLQFAGRHDFGAHALRWDAGLRYATTDQIIAGQNSVPDPRNTPPSPAVAPADGGKYPNIVTVSYTKTHYHDLLPSANLAYNLSDNLILRGALSKTMTRPNPSSMLPGLSFGDPSAAQGSLGNPSLTPYISKNLDLGVEWYTGKEGYVSVTSFKKRMTGFTLNQNISHPFSYLAQYGVTYDTLNPTQQTALLLRCGCTSTDTAAINSQNVVLSEPVNASGVLSIHGLEVAWVQPLGQWWNVLDGFGYNANFTQIHQKGTGAAPAIALGVPNRTWNFTAYYEKHGYSIHLSDTYRDGSQAALANQNGIGAAALYNEKYEQVDLSASVDLSEAFNLSRKISLTLDATNLGNSTMRQDFQFTNAPNWWYKPGRTIMVGVRGSF